MNNFNLQGFARKFYKFIFFKFSTSNHLKEIDKILFTRGKLCRNFYLVIYI